MTTLNWALAGLCVLCWGGAATWYFRHMIRDAWLARNDKWFRD